MRYRCTPLAHRCPCLPGVRSQVRGCRYTATDRPPTGLIFRSLLPAGNALRGADEFVCRELQYFYDPADGHPWQTGRIPEFVYSLTGDPTRRPWKPEPPQPWHLEDSSLQPSGELAVPIMESTACGIRHDLPAVNVSNRGAISNLPAETVVEVPAIGDAQGIHPLQLEPLPEAIAAMIRLQASIHQLLVEAFAERSKDKLLQAVLLDPTVDSYHNAVQMVDEMLELQKDILLEIR